MAAEAEECDVAVISCRVFEHQQQEEVPMKTYMRLACVVALATFFAASVSGQTVFRSVASGNWATAATWEKSTDGGSTWAAATASTASADSLADVIIQTGTTVIV